MSSDDNLYRAPRSSLQAISQDGELTPAIVEYLSKAAFWARLQSVGYFLGVIAVPVGIVLLIKSGSAILPGSLKGGGGRDTAVDRVNRGIARHDYFWGAGDADAALCRCQQGVADGRQHG